MARRSREWRATSFVLIALLLVSACAADRDPSSLSEEIVEDVPLPSPSLPAVDPSPTAPAATPSATALPSADEPCGLLLTQYPTGIPDSRPTSLTAGPDDALWFTDRSVIGRMTTRGETEAFPLPTGVEPAEITTGPDGAMWFTDPGTTAIGRITTAGSVRMFPTPTRTPNPMGGSEGANPVGIEAGPDGALWFSLSGADRIGRITTDGEITELDLPGRDQRHIHPRDMIAGPDGWMWFGRNLNSSIGGVHPTTHELRKLPLPDQDDGLVRGHTLAAAHGAVWFDNPRKAGHAIGKMTASGETVTFPLPGSMRWPSVGQGAGDDVWFTASGAHGDWIGRMTASGEVTRFPLPKGSIGRTGPKAIARGSDGATWFVEPGLGAIARVGCPTAP